MDAYIQRQSASTSVCRNCEARLLLGLQILTPECFLSWSWPWSRRIDVCLSDKFSGFRKSITHFFSMKKGPSSCSQTLKPLP